MKGCNIGFIQGRLSPIIDGRIQCFPWGYWQNEFSLASQNDFHLIEWTLDHDRLYQNPFMTEEGQQEIKNLMAQYQISISSLTGDCFMQMPFYKFSDLRMKELLQDFQNIIHASGLLNIDYIVMPLVDHGAVNTEAEEKKLFQGLSEITPFLRKANTKLVFELDFSPKKAAQFIERLDERYFGINYDIGNSASLGYMSEEEFAEYGHRIWNVHVKDRKLHGGTVPLGEGDADFETVFQQLKGLNYNGNYILQTARAKNDEHLAVLCQYRDKVKLWI